MIRTTITPTQTNVEITIPKDYVGKQIEIFLFSSDEISTAEQPLKENNNLRGKLKLTDDQYKDFNANVEEARHGWNSNI
jgi:hypothetical protein